MATAHHPARPEVYTITGARKPQGQDMHERMVKYVISMSIRTVCFVLTVVIDNPVRWVFLVGAFALPYVAVLIANAGRERVRTPMTLVGRGPRGASDHAALSGDVLDDPSTQGTGTYGTGTYGTSTHDTGHGEEAGPADRPSGHHGSTAA